MRPGLVLLVTAAAAFVAGLDLFIVNIAFTDIGRDFGGTSLSTLSWVLNGYAIVYAALLVPLGRLADRTSRRAGFLAGLALFTAASAVCATAPSVGVLVAARVVQAVGAAALTPTSLGLLLPVFAPERRANAVRIWAASGALAAAFGPVVGGVLVQASWRWVFLVNIPIGLVTLAATVRFVPDSRDPEAGPVPDLLGALLVAVGVGALALGLVQGNDWGWSDPRTIGALVAAAAAGGLFWWRNLSHPVPVVEPALLRVRSFAWANATSLIFSISFAATLLCAVLWLQQVWGESALRVGLELAPGPLMVPVFAVVASLLVKRRAGVGLITAAGCVLCGVGGVVLLTSIGPNPEYVTQILPGWLIGGAGVGLALPTILSSATADLPAGRAATGSAVVTMSRQVGTVLGVSLLVALLGTPHTYAEAHRAFQTGWGACALLALLAAIPALGMTPRRTLDPATRPVPAGAGA
ncbi:MAG: MFS transporter [Pseudonocardiales bacterium]|nr:MAG: MFS transporter [Pseudonocardiales bacterium]